MNSRIMDVSSYQERLFIDIVLHDPKMQFVSRYRYKPYKCIKSARNKVNRIQGFLSLLRKPVTHAKRYCLGSRKKFLHARISGSRSGQRYTRKISRDQRKNYTHTHVYYT